MSTTTTAVGPIRGRVTKVEVTIEYDFKDGQPPKVVTRSVDVDRYIALCWRPPNDVDSPHETTPAGVKVADTILGKFYAPGVTPQPMVDAQGKIVKTSDQIVSECRARHGQSSRSKPNQLDINDVKNIWNCRSTTFRMSAGTTAAQPIELLPAAVGKGRPCDADPLF
jgi:hypothetical protein